MDEFLGRRSFCGPHGEAVAKEEGMKITVPMVPPSPNALRRRYRNLHVYKLREAWAATRATGAKAPFLTAAKDAASRLDASCSGRSRVYGGI